MGWLVVLHREGVKLRTMGYESGEWERIWVKPTYQHAKFTRFSCSKDANHLSAPIVAFAALSFVI